MVSVKEALQEAEILKKADPATLILLSKESEVRRFKKGEHLFWDKDEVAYLYIVITGRVSLYKISNLGDKKVVFVYGAGKLINESTLQGMPEPINCEVLESSQILLLPVKLIWSLIEKDRELTRSLIDSMSMKIRRLYRQLKNSTNSLNGEKKLAAKLFKLAKDFGIMETGGIRIDFKLTVTYLAEMLGSKRETVSRQLKKLCEMELIRFENNQFVIVDEKKLSEYFKSP